MHHDRVRALSGQPLAYFITFRCYGTWLPGDDRGWVDRRANTYDSAVRDGHAGLLSTAQSALAHESVILDRQRRTIVDRTVREVCAYRAWTLHALNVRTNHVHLVVTAPRSAPEQVMSILKAWSTRRLREAGLVSPSGKLWARHGSTRYLWTENDIDMACSYVIESQGADLV
jgi:REP element-mobilizing transposase RayT